MNRFLHALEYGTISFKNGWPGEQLTPALPLVESYYFQGTLGSIHLQELKTSRFLFRYFVLNFVRKVTLLCKEKGEGVQSIVPLKGNISFNIEPDLKQIVTEGDFTILDAGRQTTEFQFQPWKEYHILNTYFPYKGLSDLQAYFPLLKQDLKRIQRKPSYLVHPPRRSSISVLDDIRRIFYDQYFPEVQKYQWELRLRQILLGQLAQFYFQPTTLFSSQERQLAEAAKDLIEKDIRIHFTNEELAKQLSCSESSLKRAFLRCYGMGMYEYLRMLRMNHAKELLLKGEQVKVVAPAVGMRASHFTMEFQRYFGYRATSVFRSK